jgi:putative phosphoesterase
MLRRVGAIGDIHAEDEALERALAFLREEAVDSIVAVGDIVDGHGDAGRCFRLLSENGVHAVRGNHDRWALADVMRDLPNATTGLELDQRAFLDALPVTRSFETPAGPLLLCHGLGDDDMSGVTLDDYGYALESNNALQELLATKEYRFVINGHTHRRMVRDLGGLTVINVGTIFRDHEPCFAIVDFEGGQVNFYEIPRGSEIRPAARHEL